MALNKAEQLERESDKHRIEHLQRCLIVARTARDKLARLAELLADHAGLNDEQVDQLRRQVSKEFEDGEEG